MEKIVVHHFWLRGIRLWLLVLMCLFHISQSFAQIKFRFHKWYDENGKICEKLIVKCDPVVIDGVTYIFHPSDPLELSFLNDDYGLATPQYLILHGGYFTVEKYNDDLCSNVVLRGSLSGHYPNQQGEGYDFKISYKGIVAGTNPTQEEWEKLDNDDGFYDEIRYFDNDLHAYIQWTDFTFPVREVASDLFAGKEKLESVSGKDNPHLTDMSGMFSGCTNLKSVDLSNFDTSKVTNMEGMFSGCTNLTDINWGSINTSKLTSMSEMFEGCRSLTSLNLSCFNTSNVTRMDRMFEGCSSLTSLDLSSFDTSNVTDMSYMFSDCIGLTSLDVSNFDTGNVTNMSGMFSNHKSYMPQMLYDCTLTSLDVSNFNTSNVKNMSEMFLGCCGLTSLDISNFDTSKVTDMSAMFYGCSSLTSLDVSNFNTSNVTDMSRMFSDCSDLTSLDVSYFNTSNVTNLSGMFSFCYDLTSLDVSNFNTSNVTNMSEMFYGCGHLKILNLLNFDFGAVNNICYMFGGCYELLAIFCKDDLTGIESRDGVFSSCSLLVGGNGTVYDDDNDNKGYARPDEEGKPGYFSTVYSEEAITFADSEVKRICVENWDINGDGELSEGEASLVRDMGEVFAKANITSFKELEYFTGLTFIGSDAFSYSTIKTVKLPSNIKTIGQHAFDHTPLTSIDGGTTNNDIVLPEGVATIINGAFAYCNEITSITIPASATSVESSAFYGNSLTAFYVDEKNPKYTAIDGVLFGDGTTLWTYPANKPVAKYEVPEGTTAIAGYAFWGVNDNSPLKDLVLPTTMTEIGWEPGFHRVAKVTSKAITPPSGSVFVDGASGTLFVPKGCKQAYAETYFWGGEWGYSSRIREFYEEEDVTYDINEEEKKVALSGMTEDEVIVEIPETVTIDGDEYGVTGIAPNAFEGNESMKEVMIPASITSIGENAFGGCKNLSDVWCYSKNPIELGNKVQARTRAGEKVSVAATVFAEVDLETCVLHVPAGSKALYEVAEGWGEFKTIVEMVSEMPGDANNDGKVDADDIDAITRYIMEGDDEGFILKNADVNGDEEINAADIVIIINKIK